MEIISTPGRPGQRGDRPSLLAAYATDSPIGFVPLFPPPVAEGKSLTAEELFVFDRTTEGRTIAQIAVAMRVSTHRVLDIRNSVLKKCECKNVVDLLVKLLQLERDKVTGEVVQ